ncbi:MAG TPA: hypothetical protein VGZ29_09990 [Terriglobia bacterium]|nr:hypothetical protein [Terriglobia bacterium]
MQATDITDDNPLTVDSAGDQAPQEPENARQLGSSGTPGGRSGRTPGPAPTANEATMTAEEAGQETGGVVSLRSLAYQSSEWALIETLGALRAAQPDDFPEIFPAGPELSAEEAAADIGLDAGPDAGPDAPPVSKSAAKMAANRANALKSTGPRTGQGKRRSRMNGLKSYSGRLYGAVQSRTLRLDLGGAERIYQELVRPYERPGRPVPPMLAMHLHDLARLRLELESWERIRDAELQERWRQGQIERRQRLHDLMRDLPGTNQEMVEKGLRGLPESPPRAKKLVECLTMLGNALDRHEFDIGPELRTIYGRDMVPASDRALIICIQGRRLMSEKRKPLSDYEFEQLRRLVTLELQDAVAAYGLYVDHATLPEAACVARLRQTADDRAMTLQGERLRQAIDRKQRVIISLLRVLGLNRNEDEADYENAEGVERERPRRTSGTDAESGEKRRKKDPKILQSEANKSFGINKGSPETPKSEPKKSP